MQKVLDVADEFGSRNPQQRKQLKAQFSRYQPEDVFEGLFAILCMDCENRFERHQLAGKLLYAIRPRLYIKLVERIRPTLRSWNVSIEEWPWYLVDLCGSDRVLEAATELASQPLSDDERNRLDVFVWWSKGFPGRGAHNQPGN